MTDKERNEQIAFMKQYLAFENNLKSQKAARSVLKAKRDSIHIDDRELKMIEPSESYDLESLRLERQHRREVDKEHELNKSTTKFFVYVLIFCIIILGIAVWAHFQHDFKGELFILAIAFPSFISVCSLMVIFNKDPEISDTLKKKQEDERNALKQKYLDILTKNRQTSFMIQERDTNIALRQKYDSAISLLDQAISYSEQCSSYSLYYLNMSPRFKNPYCISKMLDWFNDKIVFEYGNINGLTNQAHDRMDAYLERDERDEIKLRVMQAVLEKFDLGIKQLKKLNSSMDSFASSIKSDMSDMSRKIDDANKGINSMKSYVSDLGEMYKTKK